MEIKIKTTKEDIYDKYLSVLTGGSGLSGKERLILGELMRYTAKYPDNPEYALASQTRRRVEAKLKISSSNFNNYVGMLKAKKAIIQLPENNNLVVNPRLMPIIKDGVCDISFKFIVGNE